MCCSGMITIRIVHMRPTWYPCGAYGPRPAQIKPRWVPYVLFWGDYYSNCPYGPHVVSMWGIWAPASPDKTQMGPICSATWVLPLGGGPAVQRHHLPLVSYYLASIKIDHFVNLCTYFVYIHADPASTGSSTTRLVDLIPRFVKPSPVIATSTVRPRKTEPWINGMLWPSCGVYDYYHIYFMKYDAFERYIVEIPPVMHHWAALFYKLNVKIHLFYFQVHVGRGMLQLQSNVA